ncbi:MAG: N-acetylglucosamine-phosphate uridyltransferase / Glucosamine-phosphate N-acetyltransferase [Thermoleophilia bacterium]|jgi:bifunctional UDP-N-acetylglucosamine pyrophosphorylase/glucosamine-1-phosphate N-acetyltransferase|nr:N-acetylglucosamine-phosphate uridyltransferase / Glucosamine-phosphate N-acetyltransferase [Thermoleophilia bacterium]
MTTPRQLAVVVLAAGKGTRMKSDLPKVLHTILGRTVLGWVIAAVEPLRAERVIVVTGHGAGLVEASLPAGVVTARQVKQRGSGDAVAAALPALEGFVGDVLVVNGDGALFTTETMRAVVEGHQSRGSVATALAIPGDVALPYGRVLRGDDDRIERIVEAADATPEQLAINELNAGVYAFDADVLRGAVPRLSDDNSQGELYITDLLGIARGDGGRTLGVVAGGEEELLGINTRLDVAVVEGLLRARILEQLMLDGVAVSMPETVLVEPTVRVAADALLLPGTILRGSTHVAAGATIGPATELVDTSVATGAVVERSVAREATIGANAVVGPFAFLRPGTQLHEDSKAGAFVELKNTEVGRNSKVPHLSYIGDTTIGSDTNIGAGNITANYRPELGRGKQRTTIGSKVRTGSDTVLVAPVTLGDGAWTGAGSVVVKDVPAGALAIARAHQKNIEGYAERTMEGAPR